MSESSMIENLVSFFYNFSTELKGYFKTTGWWAKDFPLQISETKLFVQFTSWKPIVAYIMNFNIFGRKYLSVTNFHWHLKTFQNETPFQLEPNAIKVLPRYYWMWISKFELYFLIMAVGDNLYIFLIVPFLRLLDNIKNKTSQVHWLFLCNWGFTMISNRRRTTSC